MPLRFKKYPQPEYTTDQVRRYLFRISYQYADDRPFSIDSRLPEPTLVTLSRIMLYHLTSIPFENASIHYEPQHAVDVSPNGAFHRFVNLGRGGYCMQHGVVLLNVLRALGYNVFSCSARVFQSENKLGGPQHMVLVVSLPSHLDGSSALYLVDTGFGGPNIVRPLLLKDGHTEGGRGGEEHRIIRNRHVGSSFEEVEDGATVLDEEWAVGQVLWTLQARQIQFASSEDGGWRSVYTVSPAEFVQADFDVMNFETSKNLTGIFLKDIYIIQFFLSPDSSSWSPSPNQHPDLYPVNPTRIGQHIIFGTRYSIRIGASLDRNDIVPEIKTEDERIRIIAGVIGSLCGAPPSEGSRSLTNGSRQKNREEKPLPEWTDEVLPVWAKAARESIRGRQPELK